MLMGKQTFNRIKKTLAILLVVFLATMLFVSIASAKTANNDLPTRLEVLEFVKSYQGQSNFIETISGDSEYYHPEWKWDIWQDEDGNRVICFYYKINPNRYGSIYFDSEGNQLSKLDLSNLILIKSYVGA